MTQRTGLVVWGVAVCLPLEAAGLLGLVAYSYDLTPSAGETALRWGCAILPAVVLGMAVFTAIPQRWTRMTLVALLLASVALAYLALAILCLLFGFGTACCRRSTRLPRRVHASGVDARLRAVLTSN